MVLGLARWKQRRPLAYGVLTWFPSLLVGFAVKLRNALFDTGLLTSRSLGAPVISVGNIAVGGTGKTPFVIYLCKLLQAMGEKPAILSRGYKSGLRPDESCVYVDERLLLPPQTSAASILHADEALLQSAKLEGVPVILGALRWDAAQRYLAHTPAPPSVWVLDDGFQHRQIKRDLDVVMLGEVDHRTDFSVMPKSFLREPLAGLRRAQVCIAPKSSETATVHSLSALFGFKALTTELLSSGVVPMTDTAKNTQLKPGFEVVLWCGIANPERFSALVTQLGYSIIKAHMVPDHAEIRQADLVTLERLNKPILITEKDYFRSKQVWAASSAAIYMVPIALTLIPSDELEFNQYLRRLFRR